MGKEKYIIQSADQCLEILLLLCVPDFMPHTVQEIDMALGLGKNKIYRMLVTLEHKCLVRKHKGRWGVTPEIVKIAYGFRRHLAERREELEDLEMEYSAHHFE